MATDGPTPCDPEIFQNGEHVLTIYGLGSNAIEQQVKMIAQLSQQPVDWRFVAGRARVLALGDIQKVKEIINDLLPAHKSNWYRSENHD